MKQSGFGKAPDRQPEPLREYYKRMRTMTIAAMQVCVGPIGEDSAGPAWFRFSRSCSSLPVLRPANMPFDANIAKEIDAVLAKYTRDPYDSTGHGVPRVVVLAADKSGIIYRGRAGYEQLPEHPASEQQLADAPTIQEESIFELFSCTKLVATIAALQLIEQGKMNLDSPASDFVPELKDVQVLKGFGDDGQPKLERTDAVVTIEQLLTHTAGCVALFVLTIASVLISLAHCSSVYPFKHERAEDAMRMTEHLGFGDVGPNHADAKRVSLGLWMCERSRRSAPKSASDPRVLPSLPLQPCPPSGGMY